MDRTVFTDAAMAFEQMFHCSLCLHDYTGKWSPDLLPSMHLNHVCPYAKKKIRRHERPCLLFDQKDVPDALLKERSPVFKICPAGLLECVFPVFSGETLSGAMFAGPFSAARLPERPILRAREDFSEKLSFPAALPEVPPDLSSFLAFGSMLASLVHVVSSETGNYPRSVKELIREFLNREYVYNIGLSDVAELLSLTPARASNRIRREFGQGFAHLLRERRIRAACRLLEKTSFSIEETARRSGFRDGPYFHRVFRKVMNMTPQEYRRTQSHPR